MSSQEPPPTSSEKATWANNDRLGEVLSARHMVEFSASFQGKDVKEDVLCDDVEDDDAKFNEPTGSAREREVLEARIKQLEKIVTTPRVNPRHLMSGSNLSERGTMKRIHENTSDYHEDFFWKISKSSRWHVVETFPKSLCEYTTSCSYWYVP